MRTETSQLIHEHKDLQEHLIYVYNHKINYGYGTNN